MAIDWMDWLAGHNGGFKYFQCDSAKMELPGRFVKKKDNPRRVSGSFDLHGIACPDEAALQHGSVSADARLIVARRGF